MVYAKLIPGWKGRQFMHSKDNPHSGISIPIEAAREICGMEYVCWGEGTGPDVSGLMTWIASKYPSLKGEFPLPWDRYKANTGVGPCDQNGGVNVVKASLERVTQQTPPAGIEPRTIFLERRLEALKAAVRRYEAVSKPVPREWLQELADLVIWLDDHEFSGSPVGVKPGSGNA